MFQLIRLTDSKPPKNAFLKFTIKDIGLIVDAYNFGSRPPLEGGGIFQFGVQYGGGFKYQLTPRASTSLISIHFLPAILRSMSNPRTERSNCRFAVRESAERKAVVIVELLHETIPMLKGTTIGFGLLGGTTPTQAQKIADLLNEYVLELFVTTSKPTGGSAS